MNGHYTCTSLGLPPKCVLQVLSTCVVVAIFPLEFSKFFIQILIEMLACNAWQGTEIRLWKTSSSQEYTGVSGYSLLDTTNNSYTALKFHSLSICITAQESISIQNFAGKCMSHQQFSIDAIMMTHGATVWSNSLPLLGCETLWRATPEILANLQTIREICEWSFPWKEIFLFKWSPIPCSKRDMDSQSDLPSLCLAPPP